VAAQTVSHPVDDALRDYALGKLDSRAAAAIARHLGSCATCQARLTTLGSGTAAQPQPTTAGGRSPLAGLPNYRIERRLGEGGMGEVYLAHNLLMDRPEVLKFIHKDLIGRPGAVERFLQEVRNAARLQHPNIVAAYSCLQSKDSLVLAMEYVPGQDLAELVRSTGPLPVAHACHYVRQAALGLQHAHEKRTVHRDIKPHNLMLARDGDRHIVKVLDFGLAKVTSEQSRPGGLTSDGRMMGTPDYIAPEQINDAARADIRADIYSLGCTLYFLLTGRPPFAGSGLYEVLKAHHDTEAVPVHELRPDVPPGLSAVIAKMMAKAPADRYQTPAEVAVAVHPFAQGEPFPPGPTMVPARPVEPSPGSRSTAAALSNDGQTREATPPPTFVYVPPLPPPGRRLSTAILIGLAAFGLMSVGALLAWAIGLFGPQLVGVILLPGFPEGGSVTIDNKPAKVDRDPATGVARVHIYVRTRFELVVLDRNGKEVHRRHYQLAKGELQQAPIARPDPIPPRPIPVPKTIPDPEPGGGSFLEGLNRHVKHARKNIDPRPDPKRVQPEVIPKPPVPTPRPALPVGFTPLFDGRTMKNWTPVAGWTVKDGILVGQGPAGPANLVTERADFADFELWAEIKVEGGFGGLCFRAERPEIPGPVGGYKAQISGQAGDVIPTGTLSLGGAVKDGPGVPRDTVNQYFVIHIRAVGSRITVLIDGIQTAVYDHDDAKPARGVIAFQLLDKRTVIRVRQIGVKVLEPPAGTPVVKKPEFRDLFNGKDLTGWDHAPGGLWVWRPGTGTLSGKSVRGSAIKTDSFCITREKYKDFELEVTVQTKDPRANAGIQFRSQRSTEAEKPFDLVGPQVEIASGFQLFNRGSIISHPDEGLKVTARDGTLAAWKAGEDNRVVLRCVGRHVTLRINGIVQVDQEVPNIPPEGHIGLQLPYLNNGAVEAIYHKVRIKEIPGSK
jgi:serine/threonine protein kinase